MQPESGGPGGQWQISTGGGISPRWWVDGKELYYLALDNTMMAVAVGATGGTFVAGTPAALFPSPIAQATLRPSYDVARDGRFLTLSAVVEAFTEPIHVLLNWKPPAK